jgi:hypothetical protein
MHARNFILGVATLLLAIGPVVADETKLPGHALSTKQATAQADTIFLGQLVSLDPVKARASKGEYLGKVVYVSRSANGITPAVATQNTTVRTPAIPSDLGIPVTMIVGTDETPPHVGRSYVFYTKDNKRPGETGYEALKVSSNGNPGPPIRIF